MLGRVSLVTGSVALATFTFNYLETSGRGSKYPGSYMSCEEVKDTDSKSNTTTGTKSNKWVPLWNDGIQTIVDEHGNQRAKKEIIKEAEKELISWKERNLVPGLSVCVMVKGEVVWQHAMGYADVENAIPVTPNTKMRIASISKSLTAAALGLLLEDGTLKLDEPIHTYLPSFPRNPSFPDSSPTIRQLAGHLGGIRHYKNDEFYSVAKYQSDMISNNSAKKYPNPLEMFIANPWLDDLSKSKPGMTYTYTTFGYTTLGACLEKASKLEFVQLLRTRVLERCGMNNTFADEYDTIISNRTRQYALKHGIPPKDGKSGVNPVLVNAEYANSSYKWAGGGFLSTALDLCKFGTCMMSGRLLKKETLDILFTPQSTECGKTTNYGIGWLVVPNIHLVASQSLSLPFVDTTGLDSKSVNNLDEKVIYHTGGAVGGSTILVMVPQQGITVCVLTNLEGLNGIGTLGIKMANIFANKKIRNN